MTNANRLFTIGLILMLPWSAAGAQEHDQAKLLQSSTWSGTLTWTADQTQESVSITFERASGKLLMRTEGSKEPCFAKVQEVQRMSNGTFVFAPTQPESCTAPVRAMTIARSSETEIGLLVMSSTDALLQGRLRMDNPSAEQLEDRDTLKRKLPESLGGLYRVSESGLLLKLQRVDAKSQPMAEIVEYRIVLPDAYSEDAGQRPGDLYGRGRYLPLVAELTLSEVAMFLPEEAELVSHCSPIFVPSISYRIANARRAERGDSSVPMLAMRPSGERYCSVLRTDPKACRVVGCSAYEPLERKKSMLLADEVVARQLALVARAAYEPDTTYAERLADLRQRTSARKLARQRADSGESKGYFDRGGACGAISCEEEDTLQFIVDQYW
ncbi:MAG: hypothetical protein AAF270_09130 [Pseudomonadota bacterium]